MKTKTVIARLQGNMFSAGDRIYDSGVAVLVEEPEELVIYNGYYHCSGDRRIPHFSSSRGGNVSAAIMCAAEYAAKDSSKPIRFATGEEYQNVRY